MSEDWSMASYMTIKTKADKSFKLHIGQDKEQCSFFFNRAVAQWQKYKNINKEMNDLIGRL